MRVKATMTLLVQFSLWIVCLSPFLPAQTGRRLWVLGETGDVTEYDPATFAPVHSMKVPDEALKNPHTLAISSKGQMLVNLDESSADGKAWLWTGRTAMSISRGVMRDTTPAHGNISELEAVPQCVLSADARRIYWFEDQFTEVKQADGKADVSIKTAFLAWQIDLETGGRVQVANSPLAPCKCGTGSCSETCPKVNYWIPEGGVDDFFVATNWVPGKLGATYQSSYLYRKTGNKWSSHALPEIMERVQDAAQSGAIIVYSILDTACCGWQNESDDQTLLMRNGKTIALFDERARYQNLDYDVSFFTSNARLSPDAASVAMTISSSAQPGTEIRLSEQGQTNARELASIHQAIPDLPAVEVLRLGEPPKRSALIPHATLVGWLSEKEILAIENGALIAIDVATGTQRDSRLKVANESRVFIR